MNSVNLDTLCPWDLSLTIGGEAYATRKPCWKDVLELNRAEKALADPSPSAREKMETTLRSVVKLFFPEAIHATVDRAEYDDLLAAFTVCSDYFQWWLKKKQVSALESARAFPGREAAAPTPLIPSPAAPSGK
jgi:hypothetical protein